MNPPENYTFAMSPDTRRAVRDILANGYYLNSSTLGAGGWQNLSALVSGWQEYELIINGEVEQTIRAESDKIAISAFDAMYFLGDCAWEIVKIRTSSSTIAKSS